MDITAEEMMKWLDEHGLFTPALHDGTKTMFYFVAPVSCVGVADMPVSRLILAAMNEQRELQS